MPGFVTEPGKPAAQMVQETKDELPALGVEMPTGHALHPAALDEPALETLPWYPVAHNVHEVTDVAATVGVVMPGGQAVQADAFAAENDPAVHAMQPAAELSVLELAEAP